MTPTVIAAMRTAEASNTVLLKAQIFGTTTYMADENGVVFKCMRYKGKTYMLKEMPDVIGSPFDFLLGLIRTGLAILGGLALAVHLGLYFGGFYQWLAVKYPTNAVIQFLGA